jgi:hypothetical protein
MYIHCGDCSYIVNYCALFAALGEQARWTLRSNCKSSGLQRGCCDSFLTWVITYKSSGQLACKLLCCIPNSKHSRVQSFYYQRSRHKSCSRRSFFLSPAHTVYVPGEHWFRSSGRRQAVRTMVLRAQVVGGRQLHTSAQPIGLNGYTV